MHGPAVVNEGGNFGGSGDFFVGVGAPL
jgi:hypothetical protein